MSRFWGSKHCSLSGIAEVIIGGINKQVELCPRGTGTSIHERFDCLERTDPKSIGRFNFFDGGGRCLTPNQREPVGLFHRYEKHPCEKTYKDCSHTEDHTQVYCEHKGRKVHHPPYRPQKSSAVQRLSAAPQAAELNALSAVSLLSALPAHPRFAALPILYSAISPLVWGWRASSDNQAVLNSGKRPGVQIMARKDSRSSSLRIAVAQTLF